MTDPIYVVPAKDSSVTKKNLLKFGVPVVALFVGLGVGASGSSPTSAVPASSTTVTATAATTTTVTKPVTPAACLRAVEQGDALLDWTIQYSSVVSDAFTALANSDVVGIRKATTDLKTLNASLGTLPSDYRASAAECRAAK